MSFFDPLLQQHRKSFHIHGDAVEVLSALEECVSHKDFVILPYVYDTLGIDVVREIKNEASLSEISPAMRILYIGASEITTDAAQALLKLVEEPPVRTCIVLVTYTPHLIPTLVSRVEQLGSYVTNRSRESRFLSMSVSERLAYIQSLTKDAEDKGESKKIITEELVALIRFFRERAHGGDIQAKNTLRSLLEVTRALENKSSPTKMLLEHLAVTL